LLASDPFAAFLERLRKLETKGHVHARCGPARTETVSNIVSGI
jgi:hypothetical protein